jgi:hypothetical protein
MKALPSSCFNTGKFGPSTLGFLLPYVDQAVLGDQMATNVASGASNDTVITPWDIAGRARLQVLVCPSDSQMAHNQFNFGWTNYHTNHGIWVKLTNKWDGVFGPNGVVITGVPAASFTKFANITDGTSNTAAIAEVCRGMADTAGGAQRDNRIDCFEAVGTIPVTSAAAARTYLATLNSQTALFAGGTVTWGQNPPWRWRG